MRSMLGVTECSTLGLGK